MLDPELILRWLHIIGACVLLGTGAGIAFFMMMAHRTGDTALIAGTARIVVFADMVFTATAVVAQPLTVRHSSAAIAGARVFIGLTRPRWCACCK